MWSICAMGSHQPTKGDYILTLLQGGGTYKREAK